MLPLLRLSEVRTDIGLDEKLFKPKLDQFEAEMWKRMEETRRELQKTPEADMALVFVQRLRTEKKNFEQFLDSEFTPAQRDRLIGIFVQSRGYRALANEVVARKLNLGEQQTEKIRKEIDAIREDSFHETRQRIQRVFENGGNREEIEKIFRESEEKMDWHIKKKLSEEHIQAVKELRGKRLECSDERLRHGSDLIPRRPEGAEGPEGRPRP